MPLCAFVALVTAPIAVARAEALPASLTAAVGPRSTLVPIEVAAEGSETSIRVGTGRHVAEATVRGITSDATVESVETSGGRVAVLRATGDVTVAAVVGLHGSTPAILWTGRLDLHGDPGERWADALEIGDRTGDGTPELVVGVRREGLSPCATELAMSGTRALHAGALVGVELRPTFASPATEILATSTSPGPSAPPVVAALGFTAASSDAGSPDALTAGSPRGLTDGSATTGWIEGRNGGGMGELVSGRWTAPVAIRAFALRGDAGHVLPSRVHVIGDGGLHLAVTIPDEISETAWVIPAAPLTSSCIAVVIETPREGATTSGFVEIEAYTDYDFGAGLSGLVDELVAEGSLADDAALWLARAGEPARALLLESWDRLGVSGHRRAVAVAAAGSTAAGSSGRALLARAARDDDADVRSDAITAMRRGRLVDLLAEMAAEDGAAGEQAAEALVSLPYEADVDLAVLLGGLAAEGGAARPALRRAIAVATNEADEATLAGWAETAPVGAIASAALALAGREDALGQRLTLALLERAIGAASDFADLYRIVRAASSLGRGSPALDAWLNRQVSEAETWMVRAGAIEALGARADEATMTAALRDDYPRVRVAAIGARLARPDPGALMTALAAHDDWPMVRVAALDGIAAAPEGGPAARAALDDRVAMVRVRGLEILVARGDREAWPAVEARLLDDDEWPEVSRAALAYVEAFCLAEAADALAHVIQAGAQEGAWAPDVETAVDAMALALRLGGQAAEDARRIATRSGAAAEPLLAVLEQEASLGRCGEDSP